MGDAADTTGPANECALLPETVVLKELSTRQRFAKFNSGDSSANRHSRLDQIFLDRKIQQRGIELHKSMLHRGILAVTVIAARANGLRSLVAGIEVVITPL